MRGSLNYAINKLGKIEKAVEVGVRDGKNALEILKVSDFVYLVDNYPVYDEMWSGNPGKQGKLSPRPMVLDKEFQSLCKKEMLHNIEPFKDRTEFIELSSVDASKKIEEKSLDYIYIDACHNYEHALEDIKTWYPKLKDNGVISGHDFKKPQFPGVTQAVIDFAKENQLKVVYNGDSDWWLKKKNLRIVSWIYPQPFKPYEKMAETLKKSAGENGYDCTIYPATKEDVGACRWQDKLYIKNATRPTFIKKILDENKDDLVWMDLDCIIKKPLGDILKDCDVAITLRKIEERNTNFMEKFKFINSGVMFFKNNQVSRRFTELWQSNIGENDCDQDGLNKLLLKYSKLEKYDEIVDVEGIKVKILDSRIYNFFYFPEDSSEAKVLHYKGFSFKKEGIYSKENN